MGLTSGINALIVGNYLTTLGRSPEEDLQMLEDLRMPIGALSQGDLSWPGSARAAAGRGGLRRHLPPGPRPTPLLPDLWAAVPGST